MATLNVTKRGDKWQYRFETASVDGKRKRVSKSGFKTKKEAVEAGTRALAEYNESGQTFNLSSISVADYLDSWIDSYCKMNLKYNTQLGYLYTIENHLKPSLGMYRLKSLTPSAVQEFVNSLKLRGLSRASIVGIFSTLSAALDYAIEPLKYIQYNPCNNVRIPKDTASKKETRYIITPEQFKQIIERFPEGSNFYIPLMIGYYTGVRISECFGLTWNDVDFDNQTISISKALLKRNCGADVRDVLKKKGKKEEKSAWYFNSTKTFKSNRIINIGDTLCAALKKAYDRQMANKAFYDEYYTKIYKKPEQDEKGDTIYRLIEIEAGVPCPLESVDMINVRENGQLLSMDSMKYCSRAIHYELKINFNYHSLRHTHATTLIENGANIKDVQERLGHCNIETTLNTYTHNTDYLRNQSVEIFEKAVQK